MLRKFCVLMTALMGSSAVHANSMELGGFLNSPHFVLPADTTEDELSPQEMAKFNSLRASKFAVDTVDINKAKLKAFSNVADFLKGQIAGVYVQQPSAEPGTYQNIVVRGAGVPIIDNTSLNQVRPTVFVNGAPMTTVHNFAYNTQSTKYNRLGPETDFLNYIDISSIERIEVVKDPVQLASLGPLAANGAILITTFGGKSGTREISVNTYFGVNQKPSITPVNAHYENLFVSLFMPSIITLLPHVNCTLVF